MKISQSFLVSKDVLNRRNFDDLMVFNPKQQLRKHVQHSLKNVWGFVENTFFQND